MFRTPPYTLAALLLAAALLSAGCAGKGFGEHSGPEPGQLIEPDGTAVADAFFLRRALAADYILIGENHDNPLHHQVQARLIQALAPMRPAVGLEMLPVESNPALERFRQGAIPLDDLPQALDWQNAWGFDFGLYRPVFAVLGEEKIPTRGLNVPNRVIKALRQKGMEGLSTGDRALLPQPIAFPPQEQREKLAEVFRMHEAMRRKAPAPGAGTGAPGISAPAGRAGRAGAPDAAGAPNPKGTMPAGNGDNDDSRAAFDRFVLVQSIWDTGMAQQAVALRKEHGTPVVILAGDGHVEDGRGIAYRLRLMDPGARIVLVSPVSDPKKENLTGAD